MKQIKIQLSRCLLVLDEAELLKVIPPFLFEKGIKLGKVYQRATKFSERTKSQQSE
jgi:hypothetical protein